MNMLKRLLPILVCLPLLFPLSVHARKALEGPPKAEAQGPWFTGPIITSSGHVIPEGHQYFEPTFYWTDITGSYDKHWHYFKTPPSYRQFLSQTPLQFGVLPGMEIDIAPQFAYNNSGGEHMWRVVDQPFAIAFQLLMDKPRRWWPAIKLKFSALIPLGKHDRLNTDKLGTDVGGFGSWAPTISFITGKMFHCGGVHYFSWRMGFNYTISVPVHVRGPNIWGGSLSIPEPTALPVNPLAFVKLTPSFDPVKIRGTVYPGCIFTAQQGFEFSLTHNWALALDLQYVHVNKSHFSGNNGGSVMTAPSAEQFSIAPALEYNFSANIGLIAGPWFTVAGRNNNQTNAFISWVFAISVYH
jgi:hypothetical protein